MNWMVRWMLGRYARQLGDAIVRSLEPVQRSEIARAREALDEEPTIETFTLLAYDEGGMMIGPTGARRLVCVADSGAKVVIFGRESEMKNINEVLGAGLPCIVRCDPHTASRTVNRFRGHTHWVWEHSMLEVAPPGVRMIPPFDFPPSPARARCGRSEQGVAARIAELEARPREGSPTEDSPTEEN